MTLIWMLAVSLFAQRPGDPQAIFERAVADGFLYVRNDNTLVCLDLRR